MGSEILVYFEVVTLTTH